MKIITFENPEFLWLLISLPLLVITHFYFLMRARVKGIKFANYSALKRITGKSPLTKNYIQMFLRVITVLLMVLSVAGTTVWIKQQVDTSDYVIALDVSSSMTSQDVKPSRIEVAKDAAVKFVDSLEGNAQVGLVTFSGETFITQILTDNRFLAKQAIADSEVVKAGGTDIANALVTATNVLASSEKNKVIILITDGSNTQGEFISRSVNLALGYLQDQHVIVYPISLGTGEGLLGYLPEYYNITAIFDTEGLEEIATETGGEMFSANNMGELDTAFASISETEEGFNDIKLQFPFLVLALILQFVEWGASQTRFRRVG